MKQPRSPARTSKRLRSYYAGRKAFSRPLSLGGKTDERSESGVSATTATIPTAAG